MSGTYHYTPSQKLIVWTKTNYELVSEILHGEWDESLPREYRNEEGRYGVAAILMDGVCYDVKWAHRLYTLKLIIKAVWNKTKELARPIVDVLVKVIMVILAILTLGTLYYLASSAADEARERQAKEIAKHVKVHRTIIIK